MTHRAFSAAVQEVSSEPVTFDVEGSDHTFTVRQPLPLGRMLLLARYSDGDEVEQAKALDSILRGWIIDEDHEAWDDLLGNLTDFDILGNIMEYIIEESVGRPTEASSSSLTLQSGNGST